MASQVLPMWNGALSRARAFEWHGVTLKFPARSRSGVRADDGMVVFALPAAQVRLDDWGCSCLLWARRLGLLNPRTRRSSRRCSSIAGSR